MLDGLIIWFLLSLAIVGAGLTGSLVATTVIKIGEKIRNRTKS